MNGHGQFAADPRRVAVSKAPTPATANFLGMPLPPGMVLEAIQCQVVVLPQAMASELTANQPHLTALGKAQMESLGSPMDLVRVPMGNQGKLMGLAQAPLDPREKQPATAQAPQENLGTLGATLHQETQVSQEQLE